MKKGMNKIQIVTCTDSYYYRTTQKILTDFKDKKVLWSGCDLAGDCPEDATLARDMTNAFEVLEIATFLKDKQYELVEPKICESRDEFDEYELG